MSEPLGLGERDGMSREPGMVGLVLVAHSALVADAVAQLVGRLAGSSVPVATAGGTDDGGFGTSSAKVRRALRDADRGAGVLVVADLGSAILTAKELLVDPDAEDLPERVEIADGPFVEGAVAAAMVAATGGDLAAVKAAAEEARHIPKL